MLQAMVDFFIFGKPLQKIHQIVPQMTDSGPKSTNEASNNCIWWAWSSKTRTTKIWQLFINLDGKMWLTLCNIRMLQSVTPKITVSLELKTKIWMDLNQTCWVVANRCDTLPDDDNNFKMCFVVDPQDKNLNFGSQPQKLTQNRGFSPVSQWNLSPPLTTWYQ